MERISAIIALLFFIANVEENSAKESNVERFHVADGINAIAANLGNAFAATLLSAYDFGAVGAIENYSKFNLHVRECKNGKGQVMEPFQEKLAPGGNGRLSMYNKAGGVKHDCTYVLVKQKCATPPDCKNDDHYLDVSVKFHVKSETQSEIGGRICKWAQRECKKSHKPHYKPMKFCNADVGFCMEGQIASGKHTNAFWAIYPCSKANFCPNSECKPTANDKTNFVELIKTFKDGQTCLDNHDN